MFNYIVVEALLKVFFVLITWLKKVGVPIESSVGSKVRTEKKKAQLTYMNLDETKRKLRGAYQEAENGESLLTYITILLLSPKTMTLVNP